jgi:SAM-dependent methyltransferase
MHANSDPYPQRLSAEARKWGDHLAVEATQEMHAWLDHPSIQAHYCARGLIEGHPWRCWVGRHFGGPARRSMELGCGSGALSLQLFSAGSTAEAEGLDASADRVATAEEKRLASGLPGRFQVGDANRVRLEPGRYDLIASSHSFHHFLELEHVMSQAVEALTPRGLFVLEEYVGPTQFQWTDAQMKITGGLLALLPERYRRLASGAIKTEEGRPTVEAVVAESPFESIRSAEIVPLFERYFEILHRRNLGGTLQHLLYNGIMRNFRTDDPEAESLIRGVFGTEDALTDSSLIPSDFQLLIGRRP